MAGSSLDIELVYDRYLGADGSLQQLQELLARMAPAWSDRVQVKGSEQDERLVDINRSGAVRESVLAAASERGPLYAALVAEHGEGYERLFGSAELRGSSPEIVAVVAIDQDPFARIGGKLLMGNQISLQLRRARVQTRKAAEWALEAFEDLCSRTSPAWGRVSTQSEYDAKVMSDGPGMKAVGRDFAAYLPGVFAANFYGKRYCELIGRDRLLSAPACHAEGVDDGVLLVLEQRPEDWDSPAGRDAERRLIQHLGSAHFFSKTANEASTTTAPCWREGRS